MDQVQSYWLFITAGVGLIAAVIGASLTQGFARTRQERREEAHRQSLVKGIGQEYRLSLFEALGELQLLVLDDSGQVMADMDWRTRLQPRSTVKLIAVEPRLHQAAMASLANVDHAAMAVIGFGYRELERHKGGIREALAAGNLHYGAVQSAVYEVVEGIALLYLWRNHYGRSPVDIGSVRKKELVAYARAQGLGRFNFPGINLIDLMVTYIRSFGLKVTPVVLNLTAEDYYARKPGDRSRIARHAAHREKALARLREREERRYARIEEETRKATEKAAGAERESAGADPR